METKREAIDYKFEDVVSISNTDDGGTTESYKVRFELRYDSSFLVMNNWMSKAGEELSERPNAQLILFGANQINLLTIVIATMLEAYGQPNMKNDKDLQKLYRKMAKEAKNAIIKKAT